MVFDPKIACEIKADLARWPHWETRVAGVRVKLGAQAAAVVWVVYGFDSPSARELEELQAVMLSLVAQAKAFGDIPVVVAGDRRSGCHPAPHADYSKCENAPAVRIRDGVAEWPRC